MRELSYLDFDLLVEPTGPGAYRARVLDAPTGQTSPAQFTMPFSDLEVENFLLRIGMPRRQSVRGEHSPEATAVREFGGRLFDAVFHDEVRVALATSLDHAESKNAGLRVRLRLSDCPELATCPGSTCTTGARAVSWPCRNGRRWCATWSSPAGSARCR